METKVQSKVLPATVARNRSNAVKSTGPRSVEGKSAVRWNALKHGLLSKEIVVETGNEPEKRREYTTLLKTLLTELEPQCALESLLVERIAVCYWRMRRSLRAENGEILKHIDADRWARFYQSKGEFESAKEMADLDVGCLQLEKSSAGQRLLVETLENAKSEIARQGYLEESSTQVLFAHFGRDTQSVAFWCSLFSAMARQGLGIQGGNAKHIDDPLPPNRCKKGMLKLIEKELYRHKTIEEAFGEAENLVLEGTALSASIPPDDQVQRILRYETTIERQLYRAIDQLERLQRRRNGEAVPPPISIDLIGKD